MKISQYSPIAQHNMQVAAKYINGKVGQFGNGLTAKMDNQSGKPSILIRNDNDHVVKRIDGAHVANKMSKGLHLVV